MVETILRILAHDLGKKPTKTSSEGNPMTIDDDLELEYSPLCEEISREGKTLQLQIFTLKGGTDGWSLEVVDHKNGSTVWEDVFSTDQEARDEFYRTLELEGIDSFSEEFPSKSLH